MPKETRNWRELCEQVLHERNPEKLDALLIELLEALEHRARSERSDNPPLLH